MITACTQFVKGYSLIVQQLDILEVLTLLTVGSIYSAQEMPRTATWCCLAVKHMQRLRFIGETFITYRTGDSFSIPDNGTLRHPGVWSDITPLALLPGSSPWNMFITNFISGRCDVLIICTSRELIPANFTGIPHRWTAESDSHTRTTSYA